MVQHLFVILWKYLQNSADHRKTEKDKEMKDETEEQAVKKDEDESDDEDEADGSMQQKEEAEALEVRDVAYNLEILVIILMCGVAMHI